jgi:hypothetical protein
VNRRALAHRMSIAAVGALTLSVIGGSGIAAALDDPYGAEEVAVSVDIAEAEGPGVLSMTVDGTTAALAETTGTPTTRQFTGTLPTVTVSDTRAAEDIPEGAFWYVLGSITDFSGDAGQPDIVSADSFGWAPVLTDGDPGSVSAGDEVEPGGGFTDPEILSVAYDSAQVAPEGSWSANAGLTLKTAAGVVPGKYTAQLTLSLFE